MRSILNVSDLDVSDGMVAIKFWAPWCSPCSVMDKVIAPLCEEYSEVSFFSVDIAQIPALAKQFKIKTIPTILLLSEGNEFGRIIGTQTASQLRKEFDKFVGREEMPVQSDFIEIEDHSLSSLEELAQVASG